MPQIKDETQISGIYSVGDWKRDRQSLLTNNHYDIWQAAFNVFYTRVKTRFLTPIDRILASDIKGGEGFTVAAIQCILVEFLAAFYFGKIYVSGKEESELSEHEYSSSTKLVVDFLTGCEPFKDSFNSKQIARDFFSYIRCGLLHEAATKKSAVIWVSEPHEDLIIKKVSGNLVLYRDNLQQAIVDFLNKYKKELQESQELQSSFIRKMDDICQIR